jgi:hypothetical protein
MGGAVGRDATYEILCQYAVIGALVMLQNAVGADENILDWWNKGINKNIPFKDWFAHEVGQKTFSKEEWKSIEKEYIQKYPDNPAERGRAMLRDATDLINYPPAPGSKLPPTAEKLWRWLKVVMPDLKDWGFVKPGDLTKWHTLGTGPTPPDRASFRAVGLLIFLYHELGNIEKGLGEAHNDIFR